MKYNWRILQVSIILTICLLLTGCGVTYGIFINEYGLTIGRYHELKESK